jgi:hypothetical protein
MAGDTRIPAYRTTGNAALVDRGVRGTGPPRALSAQNEY